MEILRDKIAGVPVVMLYAGRLDVARVKGCVLCYHGLGSSTDEWLHDLRQLAERGLVAIGIDTFGHGERHDPDFETIYSQTNPNFWRNFAGAVQATAAETPRLLDELVRRGFALENRVGALGVSMGGFIVYSAVLLEPRLRAVVTLVSSPEWWAFKHPDSPHHHLDGFNEVQLLSITAGRDETVPNRFTYSFHERLEAHFADYDKRMAHRVYPQSDHLLNPDWNKAWSGALDWLAAHLT